MNDTTQKKKPTAARAAASSVLPRARCGVCRTHRVWPEAMAGHHKRFFCMTCERNTTHQKTTQP